MLNLSTFSSPTVLTPDEVTCWPVLIHIKFVFFVTLEALFDFLGLMNRAQQTTGGAHVCARPSVVDVKICYATLLVIISYSIIR